MQRRLLPIRYISSQHQACHPYPSHTLPMLLALPLPCPCHDIATVFVLPRPCPPPPPPPPPPLPPPPFSPGPPFVSLGKKGRPPAPPPRPPHFPSHLLSRCQFLLRREAMECPPAVKRLTAKLSCASSLQSQPEEHSASLSLCCAYLADVHVL